MPDLLSAICGYGSGKEYAHRDECLEFQLAQPNVRAAEVRRRLSITRCSPGLRGSIADLAADARPNLIDIAADAAQ